MAEKFKIVVTGPECSGKTTLAKAIAKQFGMPKVEEFARNYIGKLERPYQYEDLFNIAIGQLNYEDLAFEQSKRIVCDTDLLTLKIWSEDKFGKVDTWIEEQFQKRIPDIYLLCKPEMPWKADGQREDANRRQEIFELYEAELKADLLPYSIIERDETQRLASVVKLLGEYLSS